MLDLNQPGAEGRALMLANEHLSAIVAASPLAMISTDFERNVVFWNAAAERLFGWTAAEVVGERLPFVPEDREDESQGFARRIQEGERIQDIETVRLHRSGAPIEVSISLAPVLGLDGLPSGTVGIIEDIGDRRHDAAALAESELRLRWLANSMDAIVCTASGADGVLDFYNERFYEYTGMTPETRPALPFSVAIHADDYPRAAAEWQQAVRDGMPIESECRLRRADGQYRWQLVRATPARSAPQGALTWVLTIVDIHELRQAQETLAASEERWRILTDAMPAIVCGATPDGTADHFNERWFEYTGLPRDAMHDGLVPGVFHPDEREVVVAAWGRAVRTGEPYDLEYRLRRADGAYRWHLAQVVPVRGADGLVTRWISSAVDIDDRKRAEEAVGKSEQRWRGLTQSMPALVATTDADGVVNFHNERWGEFTGLSSTELRERWSSIVHPDDLAVLTGNWQAALEGGRMMTNEYRIRRHDRAWCWHRSITTPVRDATGAIEMWIDACIDIDDQKQALEELQRANAAKDEFLGLVSHELRTPITTIFGNAEILEKRGDRVDEESRRIALGDIRNEAERLHRIIDNLLVLARLERGQQLDREPILISRIVERVVAEQRRQHPNSVIMIASEAQMLPVLAAPGYVEQVLRNLLSNAQKYGDANCTIDVTVTREGDSIVTRVLDRGAGISHEDAERIFMPFFRAASTALQAQGVGIGLAVCKRLIEAQSGEMSYRPRDGGGSEFAFSLPLATDPIDD